MIPNRRRRDRKHPDVAEHSVATALKTRNGAETAMIGAMILDEPRALGPWPSRRRGRAER